MALLRRIRRIRAAAGAAGRLAATGAVLAAAPALAAPGLLGDPARAAGRLARAGRDVAAAGAGGSLQVVRSAAETGTRAVGTVVTGAAPIPDGHVRSIARTALGMLEPPRERQT